LEKAIIRKMSPHDLEEVLAIERMSFSTPWVHRSFQYEMENKDTILKVAVIHNSIAGYVCLRTILDVSHLLNLAVIPAFRRTGIGTMLFQNALRDLTRSTPDTGVLALEVRESNIPAIRLYEKSGFTLSGKRIGYFQKPRENAVIMELNIREQKHYV
jgi:ribosomal-protein-alanine N-acetyltransferase